jgi:redox-sensitive bicupin YhaK (pirin superfamily)
MNAGRGIIHSERPTHDIHEIGGRQEIIQLWINTPAAHKMDQPAYFPLEADKVPGTFSEDKKVTVRVFSGKVLGVKGPIPAPTDVNAATLTFEEGGNIEIPLPPNHQAMLYLLDGKITVDGFGLVEGLHLIHFNNDGDGFSATALANTRALLLSGAPLGEEVVSYGPFVMNNQTQVLEAMRDYQMGKMGVLIEE